jgi:IclR family acetate operon transcriptional repressor
MHYRMAENRSTEFGMPQARKSSRHAEIDRRCQYDKVRVPGDGVTMNEPVSALRRRGRPPSVGAESGGEVQSLDRAISILEIISSADGIGLSEVARRADLPNSTVHRLITTLQKRRLVDHDPESGIWTVGVGLFRMGSAYLRIRKLPDIGRPVLRELLQETGETVNLSMLDHRELVCVAQAESHAPVRAFFRLGRRLPVHASAAGKAILAASNPALRRERINTLDLERFTPNTRVSQRSLQADLSEAEPRGWAVDDEEHTIGMRCVAAAITDEWGDPIGAVSVSAPSVRMPQERLGAVGTLVKAAADQLTALFSGKGPPDA